MLSQFFGVNFTAYEIQSLLKVIACLSVAFGGESYFKSKRKKKLALLTLGSGFGGAGVILLQFIQQFLKI